MSEPVPVPLRTLLRGRQAPPRATVASAEPSLAAAVEAARAGEAAAGARIAELEAALGDAETRHEHRLRAQAALTQATADALDQALAEAVVPLALAIAARVLQAEPANAALAARLMAGVRAALPADAAGQIRLPPDLAALDPPVPAGWQLLADPALPSGTVVAEAGALMAQDSLALRLDRIAAALLDGAEQSR